MGVLVTKTEVPPHCLFCSQRRFLHQNKKITLCYQKKRPNILEKQNKGLILHSHLRSNGTVAQLNRASDYGSEGLGFESLRCHTRGNDFSLPLFFAPPLLTRGQDKRTTTSPNPSKSASGLFFESTRPLFITASIPIHLIQINEMALRQKHTEAAATAFSNVANIPILKQMRIFVVK